jgi:hypothetical protein
MTRQVINKDADSPHDRPYGNIFLVNFRELVKPGKL